MLDKDGDGVLSDSDLNSILQSLGISLNVLEGILTE